MDKQHGRTSHALPIYCDTGESHVRRAARPFVQCGMTRTVHCLVAASEVSTRFLFPEPFALAFVVVSGTCKHLPWRERMNDA